MRWYYIIIRFLKSAETFLLICWNCAETLQEMRSNFFVFTFSQEHWNFSTDVVSLCWNFARTALKFFSGCGEFVLKLCKKCAEILLFYVFSRALKVFYWCVEFVLKLCKNALKFYCFHIFSKVLKLLYGCAEFALKPNNNCAENLIILRFLKSAEIFLLMCWIFAETLQELRWNFTKFQRKFSTCVEKFQRWNFSTDVLNLRWK